MSSTVPKRRSGSFLGFKCGCKDSKSVSVSASGSSTTKSPATPSADTMTLTSPGSTSSYWEEEEEEDVTAGAAEGRLLGSSASTPSFSGLLRQLSELERTVMAWGACAPSLAMDDKEEVEEEKKKKKLRSHLRISNSEGGGGGGGRGVEDCVPVVKESEDPLGDFRRSMLQMIIEKEIVDGEELRELLRRFLALNSPRHHDLILRAFAEIWEEVFSGYEDTPDLLHRSYAGPLPSPPPF